MNNSSDFANFGELYIFFGGGGSGEGGRGSRGGAQNGSLCPGRKKPSLRFCCIIVIRFEGLLGRPLTVVDLWDYGQDHLQILNKKLKNF